MRKQTNIESAYEGAEHKVYGLALKGRMHVSVVCIFKDTGGYTMQITDVRVRKVAKEGKMRAVVSITIDNEFVIHDIKVIEGEKGLFIAMPSRKSSDGEYRDIAHPINSGTREMIQSLILEKYEQTSFEEPDEV